MSASQLRISLDAPLIPIVIICGTSALAVRPSASLGALIVTVMVGFIGAGVVGEGFDERRKVRQRTTLAVLTMGTGPFVLARWMHPMPWTPFTVFALVASITAAVAEELFFRKLLYNWLARWSVPLAIGGAAVIFAALHVPAYGVAAVPVDLAAGALFGWQRWASGRWEVPAMTHAVANVLQFLR